MSNTTFVVANGLNTSYIDSLIMALFYRSTHLQNVLTQYPENSKFLYLQELISHNFIDNVRHNYSIDKSIINEIRNYSLVCGWKDGCNITDLYNVVDYMKFIMNGFNFGDISLEIIEYNQDENEKIRTINMNYFEVPITKDTNVKALLEKWGDDCVRKNKNSVVCHRFKEIPLLIPIYFNRYTDGVICQIDIKKRIKFRKNNDVTQNKASWVIHSLICFSNSGGGNYYSVINNGNDQWYLFSNDKIPSLIRIKISDSDISNKIKQECVVALYRLDDHFYR